MLLRIILLFYCCFSYSAQATHNIIISPKAGKMAEIAFKYAKEKQWQKALSAANNSGESVVKKIILIKYYGDKESKLSGEELRNFIIRYKNWPSIEAVRKKYELYLINEKNEKEIIKWAKSFPPLSFRAKQLVAEINFKQVTSANKNDPSRQKLKEHAEDLIRELYIKNTFSTKEEAVFLEKYGQLISNENYIAKINYLLWQDNFEEATRLLEKTDPLHQKLFRARISLMKKLKTPQQVFPSVPASLQQDPNLIYLMLKYYLKQEDYQLCFDLLKKMPKSNENPGKMWKVRNRIIREAIDQKNYQLAYDLTKNRGKLEQQDEPEAEWLAGWLCYSFLNKLQTAYHHFENIYNVSFYPINKARGAYWAAKAAKHLGQKDLAEKWYRIAAEYNFTFYGQLAAVKLDKNHLVKFASKLEYTKEDLKSYKNNDFLRAAYILALIGHRQKAEEYLERAILQAKTHGEYVLIVSSPKRTLDNLWISVSAAKFITRKKQIFFPEYSYPQLELLRKFTDNPEFVHSIIRQETMFNPKEVSGAGAVGLMQIMPSVGKDLSEKLNLKYSVKKLLNDPHYNAKLGTHLLDELLNKYNGSYILAAAAYNAGPSAVEKWLKTNGDPRDFQKTIDILNWIEHVPYKETREYVMRVLENIQVYKILKFKASTMDIKKDLRKKQ